jgi:nucleotide-binding universal stress UspA family protein
MTDRRAEPHAADGPVLIAFDGSENARHAIAVAGQILGSRKAEVIHAWEPVSSASVRSAVYALPYNDAPELLEEERRLAEEVATEGLRLAREAGFDATGAAVSGSGPLWATIVDRADQLQPALIVMGTRGLSGLRSALAGSVSHSVTSHTRFPVLSVPLAK